MNADVLLSGFVTLLVTVDPLGLIPIFLSLTHDMSRAERWGVALRAGIFTFFVLVFFALAGGHLLAWLAISLPAFRIAGGLLLFWIAFQMVFSKSTEKKQEAADIAVTKDRIRDIAAVPFAIPLMAGPGAITAVILLSARADGSALGIVSLIGLLGAVAAICAGVFMLAAHVSHLLGSTGHLVLSRLLGLILSGLAVQFVIDGLKDAIG
jgi:multiple antibiotic resistance protein